MKRIAFVIPRFGGPIGGAESLCGALAKRLSQAGNEVEILTTCATDHRTWENVYPEGSTLEDGLLVRRFAVEQRNLDVWVPLEIQIHQYRRVSVDEQLTWLENGVTSFSLFYWIANEGENYDALIFAPYLFGTTFWGALIHPEKSVLLPCLHDESYAYQEVIQHLFKTVRGCIFNAAAEARLCRRLYGAVVGGVVGMGFDSLPSSAPLYTETDEAPYLLYLGRKEGGKNVPLLIDLFLWYIKVNPKSNLNLVIMGGGDYADLKRPSHPRIIDRPHCTEDEKRNVLAGATALVQPSVNESFSIVLMEAWRLGTPVLVHGDCAVTREHVEESGGGLFFSDSTDFYGAVATLEADYDLRKKLGEQGNTYVRDVYSWPAVLARFDAVLEEIFSQPTNEFTSEADSTSI